MSEGVRDEQRKLIKYNHLVSNLLIFHTIASMTRALDQMAIEGIAVDADALANLSPYQTEHINRFGHYTLNFARVPAPLPPQIAVPAPRSEAPSVAISAQEAPQFADV